MTKYDYVILCDSTSKLEDISNIRNQHNALIITFDYASHFYFLKQNFEHVLSDDYLNDDDLDRIQDLSYELTNWYNESEISNLIEHEEINIGELYYLELGYYLPPIIKKIYELQKIVSKFENPYFFVSNSIIKLLKLFSSNFEVLSDDSKKHTVRINDELSTKFGNITVKTNSDNSFLVKTIGLAYGFFNKILSAKKINVEKPTILFVNFTTLRMQKFFEELPNHAINLIKYDTIVPAFWNFTTFSLIKKSGCHIENNGTISKNNDFVFPQKFDLDINQKLNDLAQHEFFFNQFFSVNGISFWSIIKNDFLTMFSKNYENAIKNITRIKYLFRKYPISYVILRSECDPLDLVILHLAKKFSIKTSMIQHALYYDDLYDSNYYYSKSDAFHRVLSKYSDNFFTWGELTKLDAEKHGILKKNIFPLGSPFFDLYFEDNLKQKISESYVLLASTPTTSKNQSRELSVKTQIEYNDNLSEICKIVTKLDKKLVIKLHHGTTSETEKIAMEVNSEIVVKTTGRFYDYVKNCEVLICLDMSTAILEGMILKKPVILILLNDKTSNPELFKNDYLIIIQTSELEETLKKLLEDESYRRSILRHQEPFFKYYLNNLGTSSKELLNFLESTVTK